MVLAIFIVRVVLIGWFAPAFIVSRMPSSGGFDLARIIALALSAGFIWLGAMGADALRIEDQRAAFDCGFNAWKIMLLIATASALHTRRRQIAEGG